MELPGAINLLEKGILKNSQPQLWADLGAGDGLFASALSTLLEPKSIIFAVDKNPDVLAKIKLQSPEVSLKTIQDDFTNINLKLEKLDGILMVNSLHYVSDKFKLLKMLQAKLKSSGRFLIAEYDMHKPNGWVPFPIRFDELKALGKKCGYTSVNKVGEQPSIQNSSTIYCAVISY